VDFFGELSDKALHFIAYFDPAVMAAAGFKNRRAGVCLKPGRNRLRRPAGNHARLNGAGIIARIVLGKGDHRAVAEPVGILVN
jgi:hypothetical protein